MPQLETRTALTVAEIAKKFKVNKKTVYGAVGRNELQATRIGRAIRITPESFDAWLAGQKPKPPAIDEQIAAVLATLPPLTDQQIDDIVAIIRADRGVA